MKPTATSLTLEAQERLYDFPYHHIPRWDRGGFQHFRALLPAYEYATYIRYLVKRAGEMKFQSALDFGCGDGRLCAELRGAFPAAKITGVDVSPRAIAFAKAFAPECDFLCTDVTRSDSALGPFDVVFMVEVLEHLEPARIPGFFAAIARRLSPGGRLLLTVPSSNVRVPQKHFQHFDAAGLRKTLEEYFCIDEMVPLNRKSAWESAIYRLMGNKFFILSNPRILSFLFRHYERRLLSAPMDRCRRLFAMCTARVKPPVQRPYTLLPGENRDGLPSNIFVQTMHQKNSQD